MKPVLYMFTCLSVLCFLFVPVAKSTPAGVANQDHPSVRAALACIRQISQIVKTRKKNGPDVACTIPVSLSETDLDEIFKAAMRATSLGDDMRERAEKYSSGIAKTLANFRAADCTVHLMVKRVQILAALADGETTIQLPDQPARCDVTTKKRKIQKLSFAFTPRIDMKNGCVSKFALNMGKIDAGCKVCFINRLYLSTQLVSLWANRMSGNVARALNIQLGPQCRSKSDR